MRARQPVGHGASAPTPDRLDCERGGEPGGRRQQEEVDDVRKVVGDGVSSRRRPPAIDGDRSSPAGGGPDESQPGPDHGTHGRARDRPTG
jgi:hypothetical protein